MAREDDVFIKPPGVRASPTMSAGQLADKAKSLGVDVITFTLGDLFPKPDEEKDIGDWMAKLNAAEKSHPKETMYQLWRKRQYGSTTGTNSMRAAAAYHFTKDTGITVTAADVRVGHGGKGTLTGCLRDLEKKDPRMIFIAAPGWPTDYDVIPTGTKAIQVATNGRGLMSPELLAETLKKYPNPDYILINAPSNPTGENYTPEEREALLRVVKESKAAANTTVLFDDPYGKLLFDRDPYDIDTVLRRGPVETELFEQGRIAVVRTASKEWGMADSRVGWLVTKNQTLLTSLQNCNESEMGGVSGRAQDEVVAALHFGNPFIERTLAELKVKRGMLIEGVKSLNSATMEDPKGTIYGWIDFSKLKDTFVPVSAIRSAKAAQSPDVLSDEERTAGGFSIKTPADMMRYLVYVAGICPVQGTPFHAPGLELGKRDWHVRFTFCGDKAELVQGIARMQEAEKQLKQPAAYINGGAGTQIGTVKGA